MPKKSNEFQRLVLLLKQQLAGEAVVTESKELTESRTGEPREVDIVIEREVAGHNVTVSIECRDHERPPDVTWVDGMIGKHADLPTDKLVLASATGLTGPAEEKARQHGIDVLSLTDLEPDDVAWIFGVPSLWGKCLTLHVDRVMFELELPDGSTRKQLIGHADTSIHTSDGEAVTNAGQVVAALLRQDGWREKLAEANEEHRFFQTGIRGVPAGYFLQETGTGEQHRIRHIEVSGTCAVEVSEYRLRHATMGDVEVEWGSANLLGKDTLLVATIDSDGNRNISMAEHPGGKRIK